MSRDGRTFALIRQSFARPPEVWAGPLGEWQPMTEANRRVRPEWGKTESLHYKSDAFRVQGWLLYPRDFDPDPDQPLSLTYDEFRQGVARLEAVGYPMERSAEDAWPHFRGWRVNYESLSYALAAATDAVPALWSGPRRWPAEPMPPQRPATRIASDAR